MLSQINQRIKDTLEYIEEEFEKRDIQGLIDKRIPEDPSNNEIKTKRAAIRLLLENSEKNTKISLELYRALKGKTIEDGAFIPHYVYDPDIIICAYNQLLAHKLVGVQPLPGPVGQIINLRYAAQPVKEVDNPLDFDPTKGTLTEALEGNAPRIKMEMVNVIAKAEHHQVTSDPTIGDLIDDIDRLLVDRLLEIAKPSKFDDVVDLSLEQDACKVNRNLSWIAMKSRRGSGNWILVSPKTIEESRKYKHDILYRFEKDMNVEVYVSKHMPDGELIGGYKGNSQVDAGLFYCPYILYCHDDSNKVAMTRHAFVENKGAFCDAGDYYVRIPVVYGEEKHDENKD